MALLGETNKRVTVEAGLDRRRCLGLRGRGKTRKCDGQSKAQEMEQPHVEDTGCDWKWWKVEIK